MIPVNLIPAGRRVARQSRRRVRRWTIAGGCFSVALVLGACWTSMVWAHAEDQDLSQQIAEAKERLATAQARERIAVHELKNAERTLATARLAADRPDWTRLFSLLSAYRGDEIQIEGIELTGGLVVEEPPPTKSGKPGKKTAASPLREKYDLKLTGVARMPQDAAAFVLHLESTGVFSKVVITETRTRDVQGIQMTAFRIDCEMTEKGRRPAASTDASGQGDAQ